jgi:hypothetical protein
MQLTVVPGWIKVLFVSVVVAGLGWWGWLSSRPAAVGDPAAVYSRPGFNPGTGLSGQAQSNVRQLLVNPLERAAPGPEGEGGTLRDGGRNYYKDE